MSLSRLIQPFSVNAFFKEIWEQNVLHIPRDDEDYFSFLGDSFQMEEVIWQSCRKWGEVSLARANTNYSEAPYSRLTPDVATVRDAFANDYTVVINNLERRYLPVAIFCRELEKELRFHSIVNLYYTKPFSQGLDCHFDAEDVFILQMEGRKQWRVAESQTSKLPLEDSDGVEHNDPEANFEIYELSPGDVLYIPRGFLHEARTAETASLHLTVTVSVIRWLDLLTEIINRAAISDIEFRKSIPIEILVGNDLTNMAAQVETLLGRAGTSKCIDEAISNLQNHLLSAKPRLPYSHRLENISPENIGTDSTVRIAADQMFVFKRLSDRSQLQFIGASIEIGKELEHAVQCIIEKRSLQISEISDTLSDEEKIELVRKLIGCQFLTVN